MHRITFAALLLLAGLCATAFVVNDRADRAAAPRPLAADLPAQRLEGEVHRLAEMVPAEAEGDISIALIGHDEVERLPPAADAVSREDPWRYSQRVDDAPEVEQYEELAEPAPVARLVAPPLELKPAAEPLNIEPAVAPTHSQTVVAPLTIQPAVTPDRNSHVSQAAARPSAEHRFSGTKDFHAPTEADPGWVVDKNEPVIPRDSVLYLQLPQQIQMRTGAMLAEATATADRGALFAARNQFLRIIRMTSQSLDAQLGKPIHSRALARGLRALDEADDFAMKGDSAESDLQMVGYIAGHRTPVLKNDDPENITALIAMQRYYKYAYEQLSLAGNDEPIASEALFSLGRIEALLSEARGNARGGGPKALALFHAALTVDPNHGRGFLVLAAYY